MMRPWPPGIFVVGTDTGVGKTRVAAAIARAWVRDGRRVGVVKPVSSGATPGPDGTLRSADVVELIAGITADGSPFPPPPAERVGPLVFAAPLAPPVAARAAGTTLTPEAVVAAVEGALDWWADVAGAEWLVVEGVGGLLCPLAEGGWTVADLAARLDFPIVIVAHRGLGTLNHTLLTVEAARARGLQIAGIVLNGARPPDDPRAEETNAAELARLLPDVPVLADWPHRAAADPAGRETDAPEGDSWAELARPPRPRPEEVPTGPSVRADSTALGVLADSADDLPAGSDAARLIGSASTPDAWPNVVETPGPLPVSARQASEGDLELGDRPRSSWSGVALFSYASAMTLALLWTLWQQRRDRVNPVASSEPSAEASAPAPETSGRLAGRSRLVVPPAPIPADRTIALGQSRQVDSLRIEPVEVVRQDLVLTRTNVTGKAERREGPKRSLVLRVRLENRSLDQVFAPLDPGFVRGGEADGLETFLELENGRRLYPAPLAVDSEWGLAGESFGDLRPGEAREVVVAVGPDVPDEATRLPATWRIKLRTGLGPTAAVGVRLPGASKP